MESRKGKKEINNNRDRKRYAQAKSGERVEDFIEMCVDVTTRANAKLKEVLRKMM